MSIKFTLSFEGADADNHKIDFYDAAQALIGFQRSLAITTHLIVNNQVITQAPSLKNARIVAIPPEEGSWEIAAIILFGTYKVVTAPKDTPLGHLVHSAYDYVVSQTLGFHVDYDKTLGQQYQEIKSSDNSVVTLEQSRLDSVVEKCEVAIKEMHRPIYANETANTARITSVLNGNKKAIAHQLDSDTYEHIKENILENEEIQLTGRISMYNINTHKGRIFVLDENRPIPFTLMKDAINFQNDVKITNSLSTNVKTRFQDGDIEFIAYRVVSKTGRLKALHIIYIK